MGQPPIGRCLPSDKPCSFLFHLAGSHGLLFWSQRCGLTIKRLGVGGFWFTIFDFNLYIECIEALMSWRSSLGNLLHAATRDIFPIWQIARDSSSYESPKDRRKVKTAIDADWIAAWNGRYLEIVCARLKKTELAYLKYCNAPLLYGRCVLESIFFHVLRITVF